MNKFILPLLIFVTLTGLLWKGLELDPKKIPSALIDKEAPAFSLPHLLDEQKQVTEQDLANEVWVLNVWASWCVGCRQEHAAILDLSQQINVVGLNYKDDRTQALNWLNDYGDPYLASAFDQAGDVGIDYGVYGIPETFVIDHNGRIRYKHIGPVSLKDISEKLLPVIEGLRSSASL